MKAQPAIIKDIADEVIKKLSDERTSKSARLNASWMEAIGEENIKHARPVEMKEKVLIVNVDSSVWLHKLTMDKANLLARFKGRMGEDVVSDIKFRIGEL